MNVVVGNVSGQLVEQWIERLTPYFWPLVGGIVALYVVVKLWRFLRSAATTYGSVGMFGKGRGTAPADYTEHHRVRWHADPARFTPAPEHWSLGVTAVYGICAGDPWDRLTEGNHEQTRLALAEAWGIRSRPQMLAQIYGLLREGHRVWLEDLASGRVMPMRDDQEQAWQVAQAQANHRGVRDVRFDAWDLVRAAMLTRSGYALEWLTDSEAVDTLNLISAHLQARYASWEEMGDHFLRARWFWNSADGIEEKQNDAHDISRQAALLAPITGPWSRLPWRQPLPESRLVLLDSLIREGLVEQVPEHAHTPLAEKLDAAAAERLAR
ncbi:DUF1266 domain-containing protein [Microbacterium sp.]|uniref:DUF1266 domain-containing protein n=1 Tax=Microbacterium sp. TaxID=51671 RepID=UPI003A865A55